MGLVLLLYLTFRLAADKKKLQRWIFICAAILLVDVVTTNIWYWTARYLVDPLPLYHCRIAKIILILFGFGAAASDKILQPVRQYACSIGLFGAISSFVYPDPDPFNFPHISLFSFYIGHAMLGVLAVGILLRGKHRWCLKDLIPLELFMVFINILIFVFDTVTGKNYSFFLWPPFFQSFPQIVGPYVYALIIFIVYGLLMLIGFSLLMGIQRLFLKKER